MRLSADTPQGCCMRQWSNDWYTPGALLPLLTSHPPRLYSRPGNSRCHVACCSFLPLSPAPPPRLSPSAYPAHGSQKLFLQHRSEHSVPGSPHRTLRKQSQLLILALPGILAFPGLGGCLLQPPFFACSIGWQQPLWTLTWVYHFPRYTPEDAPPTPLLWLPSQARPGTSNFCGSWAQHVRFPFASSC